MPRIRAISPAQSAISIVSVEEMLQGRLAQVSRAGIGEDRIRADAWLEKTLTFVRAFRILPFDDQAERRYVDLATRRLEIGARDLKFAAIALCHDAVLVTREEETPMGAQRQALNQHAINLGNDINQDSSFMGRHVYNRRS